MMYLLTNKTKSLLSANFPFSQQTTTSTCVLVNPLTSSFFSQKYIMFSGVTNAKDIV